MILLGMVASIALIVRSFQILCRISNPQSVKACLRGGERFLLEQSGAMTLEQLELLKVELAKPRPGYSQEQLNPWLSILLDIYHLIDSWVTVDTEIKGIVKTIVCQKGCGHCCKLLTVPINHLEFRGLCWYVSEILQEEERVLVKYRFRLHEEESECPFLINNFCIVYPLRPIACRQFFILNHRCSEGENPWLIRKDDIYCALNQEISWMIATRFFPLFGLKNAEEQRKAYEEGFLFENDRPLNSYPWAAISEKIK